ncbi:MAG: hypothetical protein ABIQ16_23245, partial [Polyangiaceae bacterium]
MMGNMGVFGLSMRVLFALAAVGCSSAGEAPNQERGASGASGAGGNDNTTTTEQPTGSCKESALFPAEPHGENGDDLIRGLKIDEATAEMYFSDLDEVFKVPLVGGKPTLLGARPNDDIGGDFWLTDQLILYPAGFATPVIEKQLAVVYSTDRAAGGSQVVVGIPSDPTGGWQYRVHDAQIVGKDAYWLGEDESESGDKTYFLRRTSWASP